MKKIIVIGSSNTDMVIKAKRLPLPGETLLGGTFVMNAGGKGANQAVAVSRLGGHVTLVTKVGNDIFGRQTIEGVKKLFEFDYPPLKEGGFKPNSWLRHHNFFYSTGKA